MEQEWGEWAVNYDADATSKKETEGSSSLFATLLPSLSDSIIPIIGILIFLNLTFSFDFLHAIFHRRTRWLDLDEGDDGVAINPLREGHYGQRQFQQGPGIVVHVPQTAHCDVYVQQPNGRGEIGQYCLQRGEKDSARSYTLLIRDQDPFQPHSSYSYFPPTPKASHRFGIREIENNLVVQQYRQQMQVQVPNPIVHAQANSFGFNVNSNHGFQYSSLPDLRTRRSFHDAMLSDFGIKRKPDPVWSPFKLLAQENPRKEPEPPKYNHYFGVGTQRRWSAGGNNVNGVRWPEMNHNRGIYSVKRDGEVTTGYSFRR